MSDDRKQVDQAGMRAAERFAGWHLGDKGWAGLILNAYLNPESVSAQLDEEMRERGAFVPDRGVSR